MSVTDGMVQRAFRQLSDPGVRVDVFTLDAGVYTLRVYESEVRRLSPKQQHRLLGWLANACGYLEHELPGTQFLPEGVKDA